MSAHWFESWFDSPYYPILYRHRNEEEAAQFLDRLFDFIQPEPQSKVLDLACGRGRHARHLHQKGYHVTGLDLSPASIQEAKAYESPGLSFGIHDIRDPFPAPKWNVVLNVFTSFGYFEQEQEHLMAIKTMASALLPQGILVIDFLNPKVLDLKEPPGDVQEKQVDGLHFTIRKFQKDGYAHKEIDVLDGNHRHHYREKVRLFSKQDLEHLAEQVGLKPWRSFGNYALEDWNPNSERTILLLKHA